MPTSAGGAWARRCCPGCWPASPRTRRSRWCSPRWSTPTIIRPTPCTGTRRHGCGSMPGSVDRSWTCPTSSRRSTRRRTPSTACSCWSWPRRSASSAGSGCCRRRDWPQP
ncbi:hypothetical protein ACFFX0_15080 [Citricoccus parietis]|uniref:Uncharacterized protein n=1 Tax=Citricoccus parietis TaxID=592307 RepID=A0ABV5G0J0_9MICC